MPPKKATGPTASKKAAAAPAHASYKDMIKEAILNLKERNGSSRQALKKYVQANNKVTFSDAQFNKALKTGVEKGDFTQPKGPSGPVKLAKKEAAAKPAEKKAAPKQKATTTKSTTTKKAATKKTATKSAPKKAAPKKTASAKPKANTAKPRTKKATGPAPAVVDAPKVLTKTKSGRVTKTKASAPTTKKTATKKAPAKKSATPKKATPKKTEPAA